MEYTTAQIFNPEIIYVCDVWNQSGNVGQSHHHDFLEISIILEGESDYYVEGKHLHLGAGQLLLFNPGINHYEQQPIGTYSHQLHIGLSNISLYGLAWNHFPNKQAHFDLGEYQHDLLEKAWRVTKEYREEQPEFQLMVKALIIELSVLILRSLQKNQHNAIETGLSKTAKRKQQIVNHAIYYLENHHNKEITLELLAEKLFVSPTYLSKIFKEATGVSPINYLIRVRMKHAHNLLEHNQLPIRDVAQAVGYQDAYHFSKLFKKNYGVAPSQVEKK